MRTWMRELRHSTGVTLKDVAKVMNVSEACVCQIELGARKARMDLLTLQAIARATGRPFEEVARLEAAYEGIDIG